MQISRLAEKKCLGTKTLDLWNDFIQIVKDVSP